jgi:methylated-DNA-[protein]-cysteine S-methyltransferase
VGGGRVTEDALASPIGPLHVAHAGGVVHGIGFTTRGLPPAPAPDAVREQLDAYFAGELTAFDLPFALHGTPFQRRVWAALLEVGHGETTTYGALAARLGTSARAVGLANGRNPIAVVVPCHRVVGATGGLTGYAGGLDAKRALLALEAAARDRRATAG